VNELLLLRNRVLTLGILISIIASLSFLPLVSAAGGKDANAAAKEPLVKAIYLNGWQIASSAGFPVVKGTIMIALEGLIIEGISVSYDEKSQVIAVKNVLTAGTIKVGSKTGAINGKKIMYTAEPQRINKQLFVPLRFINDAIGGKLEWNAPGRYASISYPQFVGGGADSGGYLLDGLNGILYQRDDQERIRRLGVSTVKLDPGYISWTRITATKVSEDADLITIINNYGEPAINEAVYTLFVKKGKILRQSYAHYWQFTPEDIKLYNGDAVMNDGHQVRLIGSDGSVKSTWNVSQLAGNPQANYAVEALGEGYIVARWSEEGLLTLIDLRTKKSIILFEEFKINPADNPGYLRFVGSDENQMELKFVFTNKDKQEITYTYKLNNN